MVRSPDEGEVVSSVRHCAYGEETVRYKTRRRLRQLKRENEALRQGYELQVRIANLRRDVMALDHTVYAVLTGVTAGVGLGLNRAMIFLSDGAKLRGFGAVGPVDRDEADRVWRSIAATNANLSELYEAGIQRLEYPDTLDSQVRGMVLDLHQDTVVAQSYRDEKLVLCKETTNDLQGFFHRATGIAAPLMTREFPLGVMYADNRFTERPLDDVVRLVFSSVANAAAHAIEAARRYEEVQQEARTDPLTQVGNRLAMEWALENGVRLAREAHRPLGLAILDIDFFKRVNDTYGHAAGYDVLREVARRLRAAVREGSSSTFRFGGEEFVILLPGANERAACEAGERLRKAISQRPLWLQDQKLSVTCSIGVTVLGKDQSESTLIEVADGALLEAKRNGRNQVVFAPPLSEPV